ncbi:MAG: hypothetical protein KHZ72_04650 [Lachnospiraceae bacterium]|mgnify:CR=1 FL=1|nr:hypothetical protein [Lachnospiraceae bacterium]
MNSLYVWKEEMQKLYARYAKYIDKVLQLILGILVFGMINSKLGYMELAASKYVTAGLAVLFTFLPPVCMAVAAAVLILLHMFSLSMAVFAVTAAVFLMMFIFYFRFAAGTAMILLLTPLAFLFKVPYIIPIVYGLIGTPVYLVPVVCGTVVYFMLHFVVASATAFKGGTGAERLMEAVTEFTKQIFTNKEMLIFVLAFSVCLLIVYATRRSSFDYAWKVAIAAGIISNIVLIVSGELVFDVHISYGSMIGGNVAAGLIAVVLEFFVFTVDYSRTEQIQFEDDEYYYYIKAVPKISVPALKKTIKKINERQETTSIPKREIRETEKRKIEESPKDKQEEKNLQKMIEHELEK